MRRQIHRLTKRDVERVIEREPNGFYHDGDGLDLWKRNGNATWVFQVRFGGRRVRFGFGNARALTLEGARARAREIRAMIARGEDPLAVRKERRAPIVLFHELAREFIDKTVVGRHPRHLEAFTVTLLGEQPDGRKARVNHTAALQREPIGAITTEKILGVLEPLWRTRFATADRLRGRLEDLFDYARGRGLVPAGHQNPARWKHHLANLLPARTAVHKVKHQPAIGWKAAPAFVAALRTRESPAARALELVALTALRTGDVLGLRAGDIDFEAKTLTIAKAKTGGRHVVPMVPAVVELLRAATTRLAPEDRVFPIGVTAMRKLLRSMAVDGVAGADAMTVHGLRATFRSWCADTGVPREVAESALDHALGGVEAAYQRSLMTERRRATMADWARLVAGGTGDDNVTPLRRA
jgi:integrase